MAKAKVQLDPLVAEIAAEAKRLGMSDYRVSVDAGLGPSKFGEMLRKGRNPELPTLRRLAQAVGKKLVLQEKS